MIVDRNQLRVQGIQQYHLFTLTRYLLLYFTYHQQHLFPSHSITTLDMSSSTNSAIDDVKSGLKGIHGVGESIRGNINNAVDHAAHDATGEAKNQAIANKGQAEMRQGEAMMDKHSNANNITTTTVRVNISYLNEDAC
jgi:hypothetical protein